MLRAGAVARNRAGPDDARHGGYMGPSMERSRVLALILAGGEGGRLDVLTDDRAKPAMPYAGTYRLIDFPLSNCVNSGISDVWVLRQYEPQSLDEHLANGRPWDLDRTRGGLRILHPTSGGRGEAGMHHGNADSIHRNRAYIEEFRPSVVLVLSADHVYTLDYGDVIEAHRRSGASVTMVTTEVAEAEARRFGLVDVADEGEVRGFDYKPDRPTGTTAATEVYVFEPGALLAALDRADEAGGDDGAGDLGERVLPDLAGRGDARAFPLPGYWRDVGTIDGYWSAHMELLDGSADVRLDDPAFPILSRGSIRTPAFVERPASVDVALLSPGSRIGGLVVRSVIGPGVVVERGAEVRDSVVLDDAHIGANAIVTTSIIDSGVVVDRDARVGDAGPASQAGPDDIAVVGAGVRVAAGASVAAGARVSRRG
jgi:glucose-1-phosphate adenylyltransferase